MIAQIYAKEFLIIYLIQNRCNHKSIGEIPKKICDSFIWLF